MHPDGLIYAPWIGTGIVLSALTGLFLGVAAFILGMREWGYGVPWRTRIPLAVLSVAFFWRAWVLYEERLLTTADLIVIAVLTAAAFVCMLELIVQSWRKSTEQKTVAHTLDTIRPEHPLGFFEVEASKPKGKP